MSVASKTKDLVKKNSNGKSSKNSNVGSLQTFKDCKTTQISGFLAAYEEQIKAALPSFLTVERVTQVATTLIAKNPDIAKCSTNSIVGAMLSSTMLGFEMIPELGEVYIVPKWNKKTGLYEAQFWLGYKGMISLAYRSDRIESVYSRIVYEGDEYKCEYGLKENLIHIPCDDPGDPIRVYAVVKYKDGGYNFVSLSRKEVYRYRDFSDAYNRDEKKGTSYSPWKTDELSMWQKTALKRLFVYMPKSIELHRNVAIDQKVIPIDAVSNIKNLKDGHIDINSVPQAEFEDVTEEQVNKSTGEVTKEEEDEFTSDFYKKMTQEKNQEKDGQAKMPI